MNDIIKRAIDQIRTSVPETEKLTDDFLHGIVAYKYFYNDGIFDKADFKNSYVDGANDGGIDLISVEENDLDKSLVLIQSKNVQDINSKDDIKDVFTKMSQTVSDFKNEKVGNYNDRLRRIYREKYDDASDDSNFGIKLALFLGFDKPQDYKDRIQNHLNKVESLQDFELLIFYQNEILQQIESYDEEQIFVDYGKVEIFKDHGAIENGDNGLLVNISAISLRKLYDKYKDDGLFEQNFRYFIRNKKIDDQINESLKKKRDKFWFLNNGIIIGCKEFDRDGDNIKLTDFSIVNGCQTTTIIGSYKGGNEDLDFPIPCKIVKPDREGEEYFNQFISEIAEASNSQKPISDRDLKSNLPEQRSLQRMLKQDEPKIYLEIKRGEGILKKRNLENWQKIKNDQLGQLILACCLQQPGTARSAKRKIFADKSTYNRVFKRTQDKSTIVDLLKLSALYDTFVSSSNFSETLSNVSKNGKFAILGVICFLIKNKRKLTNINLDSTTQDWVSDVTSDNIDRELLRPDRPDDFEKILNSVFNQVIRTLSTLYESRGDLETSVTNFFKTDKKYHSIILERIKTEFILDDYEYDKLSEKLNLIFK
ncbi:MAG: AIPR family protein [Bacteroidetes bacterium]|nr:AIPR family protein [Bacteroidota bacterium]